MPKFTIHMTSSVSGSTDIEVSDDTIAENGLGIALDNIVEGGAFNAPTICARCSGWGQTFSLDIDGEWDTYQVTDEDGNAVWGEGAPEMLADGPSSSEPAGSEWSPAGASAVEKDG